MQEWTLCAACRSSVHPYRTAAIAPTLYSPSLGWTRVATGLLLAAILVPVISTVGMLAALKNCDGVAVPRWDEAAAMIGASLALHFSMEHLFDTLCIDLRGIFWHGC